MQDRVRSGVGDRVWRLGRATVRTAAMATADLRPLPEVTIVGVKRGGTTSVFRDLERHPSMCSLVPSARRLPLRENIKGVHWFGDHDDEHSFRWYRSHFPTSITRNLRRRRTGHAFAAEASPYYFFHPLAAERAAAVLPHTVFVVVLRDPVERTVSHWAEQTRNGVETLSLRAALAAEPERVGDAAERLADGSIGRSHAHEQQSYTAQSRYTESLRCWYDAVGEERVVVVFSEDYYRDPATTLRSITDAIGVGPVPPTPDAVHRNAAPRPSSVDADLEAELVARFRPDVDRLRTLIGVTPPWPRFT